MGQTVRLKAADGWEIEIVPEIIGSGTMKDVYLSPDGQYAAAFYRQPLDLRSRDRLINITGSYRESVFNQKGGNFWRKLFCWPERLVEWDGKPGIILPAYDKDFFFSDGKFKGKEKEGKWFASAKLRNRFLEPEQKGNWLGYLQVCLNIARACRRLHAAGLAHSDLSYKNVLADPITGRACIIDIDGLVVPGKYPPDVVGTPDFIAPEVMETRRLAPDDVNKKLPSIATDRHALAVMIYMYLLCRHPLRGPLVHDLDPVRDEELSMGERALFIEHPDNRYNRPHRDQIDAHSLPQGDVDKLPYTICGPYLARLFERAFIEGLHHPEKRPTAAEWEAALIKTLDLVLPCANPDCSEKWFAYNNKIKPECPYCGAAYNRPLPILNLYWSPKSDRFVPEDHRIMVYDKQSLYLWQVSRDYAFNEKLSSENRKPVGDFHFKRGKWYLINRSLPEMYDKGRNVKIEPGKKVALEEGSKILLSANNNGRLIVVQMANK